MIFAITFFVYFNFIYISFQNISKKDFSIEFFAVLRYNYISKNDRSCI